jgi:transposase
LYKATSKYYGREGQASIDPVVFFKLMLFGYLENIPSDRRIVQTASMRMDILFFIGHDLDEPLPWHSTLSRTRQLYGSDVFMALFKEVLKKCIDKGMLSGKRQAVDSMLVRANASMDSIEKREIMSDVEAYTREVEQNEEGKEVEVKLLKKSPEKKEIEKRNNKTHYSTTDPEAKISTKPGKPYLLNYLGQVSVDTGSHVITHIQAFKADKRDSQCLKEILKQTKETLQEEGLQLEEVLADTNYSSTEVLEGLEEMKITGYIPNFGGYKPSREGFEYDEENDRYICSQGKYLTYKGIKNNHSKSKQYLSRVGDCKNCPIKSGCIGKSNQKMITETLSRPLFKQMESRMASRHGRKMRAIRQATAEPVIGTLMNFHNAKRLNTRGLDNANKNLIIAGIAYNLKKLIKFASTKVQAKSAEMRLKCLSGGFLQHPPTYSFVFST